MHIAYVSENSALLDLIAFFCKGILLGDIEFLQRIITRGDEILYEELPIPIAKTGIKGLIPNHGMLVCRHSEKNGNMLILNANLRNIRKCGAR